ncbi:ROK family transcriptional regulator [Agromyces ramosus]|uniref:NBD/HSP70 family sugar kinase n=1 Tax=Agromyces ramosus TaxID=33879 RepID=A0ABU0R4Y2_9MICO|nr:ROK family transcriptional regulator [Agromyces ramosus]MDQ0893123.1 putative NBD/HSP70 family sugar kinase [Agromyces ramosus]
MASLNHAGALRATGKVLPEYARGHNRSLVLQMLYRNGGQSRADLARASALTKVTVSDLVAEMLAEGLVVETRQRTSTGPGKPAVELDIARDRWQVVAVDLSDAEKFDGAVLDLDGGLIARISVPRGGAMGAAALETAFELVDELRARATAPVLGIGVGSPGIVDLDGAVLSAPNLDWTNVPMRAALAERTGLPVHVANDANAASLAEHSFGGATHDLLLLKVGHGVGAAVLANGRLVHGRRFAAGEIGHVVVGTDAGPLCACGRSGCLEAWIAVPRLEARLAEASGADAADEVLRETGRRLGYALAPVVGALGLTDVIVSGPPHLLDGVLLDAAREALKSRLLPVFFDGLELRLTEQGPDIVLRGALVLVLAGVLGIS